MIFRLVRYLYIIFIFLFTVPAIALTDAVTLDLQSAKLPDAIRLLAGFLDLNVIISPDVKGEVTLHLHQVSARGAFASLLVSQGLARTWIDGVAYIAPRDEMIKHKQEEMHWQTVNSEAMPLKVVVLPIHYAKAEEIGRTIHNDKVSLLSKRGRLSIDARSNALYLKDTESEVDKIQRLIKKLDVPVPQISIETRLVSVDSDYERELGVNFSVLTTVNTSVRNGNYSLALAKLADGSLLDVKLAALENAGHAELISSPGLFTTNQQTASIEAGEEVPYQEVSESGGTAIAFKKAVLGLKVTPQVLPGNKVLLHLQMNQDRPSNKVVLGMPTISTRQIVTSVLAHNGQTIVLGGIYETNAANEQERVPFVNRLPLLGLLFVQQHVQKSKRELLIFVTPKIMTAEE